MNTTTVGRGGEALARAFLEQKGYVLLRQNYRNGPREIDLVMRDGECIVFVEVKMRTSGASYGREAVTPAKQKRICRGALRYMVQNGLTERQARFDVIEIRGARLTHIKDAFPYQGPMF